MDKKLIVVLPFVCIVPPFFVALMMKVGIFSSAPGDVGNWISFWGSYLGAIVGVVGIFITTFIMLEQEKTKQYLNHTRDAIQESRKLLYELRKLEAIYVNRHIEYVEDITDLLVNDFKYADFYESYKKLTKWKNELKVEQISIYIEVQKLKYALFDLKQRDVNIKDASTLINNKLKYISYGEELVESYEGAMVNKLNGKEENNYVFLETKNLIEYYKHIDQNNELYLEYLSKILNEKDINKSQNISIKEMAE